MESEGEVGEKDLNATIEEMKKKLIEILPILKNFKKWRVKGSNKTKNVGQLYYDEQTTTMITMELIASKLRILRKKTSMAMSVRKSFQNILRAVSSTISQLRY
jgi:hypothetical protein